MEELEALVFFRTPRVRLDGVGLSVALLAPFNDPFHAMLAYFSTGLPPAMRLSRVYGMSLQANCTWEVSWRVFFFPRETSKPCRSERDDTDISGC